MRNLIVLVLAAFFAAGCGGKYNVAGSVGASFGDGGYGSPGGYGNTGYGYGAGYTTFYNGVPTTWNQPGSCQPGWPCAGSYPH